MRTFDVQPVFEFLRNPANLPQWAHAFTSVQDGRAPLETGAGAVDVRLGVSADAETGTLDRRGADRSVLDVTVYEGGGINNGWAGYRDRHLGLSGG